MASASTYVPIANQVLTATATSVTFSSIPSTYTDLVLIVNGYWTTGGTDGISISMQFNSDTGTNYSFTTLAGNGSSASSTRQSSVSGIAIGYISGWSTANNDTTTVQLMNYSNTTTYKTAIARQSVTTGSYPGAEALTGLWRSTSAVNAIKLYSGGAGTNTFAIGSTFTLYGIQAA